VSFPCLLLPVLRAALLSAHGGVTLATVSVVWSALPSRQCCHAWRNWTPFQYLISLLRCSCAVKNALSYTILAICPHVCSRSAASCFQKGQKTAQRNRWSHLIQKTPSRLHGTAYRAAERSWRSERAYSFTTAPHVQWLRKAPCYSCRIFAIRLCSVIWRHQVLPQDRYVPTKLQRPTKE